MKRMITDPRVMGIRSVFNVYILSRYLHVERINIKLLSLMLKTYAMCCYAGWDKKVSLFQAVYYCNNFL